MAAFGHPRRAASGAGPSWDRCSRYAFAKLPRGVPLPPASRSAGAEARGSDWTDPTFWEQADPGDGRSRGAASGATGFNGPRNRWLMNPHDERIGGVRAENPTDRLPRSKSAWFIEIGCAAIDKGTNPAEGNERSSPRWWRPTRYPCPLRRHRLLPVEPLAVTIPSAATEATLFF